MFRYEIQEVEPVAVYCFIDVLSFPESDECLVKEFIHIKFQLTRHALLLHVLSIRNIIMMR